MTFSAVLPDTLDFVWGKLEPMILRGLSKGQGDETSSPHMREAVRAGNMMLWVVHDDDEVIAGIILSITHHVMGKKLWVEMLAGRNMGQWVDELQDLLVDYKNMIGATCIEASCRPALKRLLSKQGWREKATIMELKL